MSIITHWIGEYMNLDGLNDCQKRAVKRTEGPLLIIAGAGSGKTRVLTNRIAYLIDDCGVAPYNILAITFTNKAAREMRERVDATVGQQAGEVWVSTFHSTCVRILRRYIDRIGYSNTFTIYDTDDVKSVIKDICKKFNIDTKMLKEKTIMNAISHAKDELMSPDQMELEAGGDYNGKRIANVYREYQKTLKLNNALDFDDLIYKTVELLEMMLKYLIIIRNDLSILWLMSIRILIHRSLSLYQCLLPNMAISAWLGMMISQYTSSGVPILPIY